MKYQLCAMSRSLRMRKEIISEIADLYELES